MLKALGILRRELGDEVLVVGCVLGPFTLTTQLLGLETTLYLAIDDPPRLERLMDFATEVVIRFGQAQLQAGAHLPVVFDPSASPAVIPPQFFREFELPRLQRVFQALGRGRRDRELAAYRRSGGADPALLREGRGPYREFRLLRQRRRGEEPCFRPPASTAISSRCLFVEGSPAEIEAEAAEPSPRLSRPGRLYSFLGLRDSARIQAGERRRDGQVHATAGWNRRCRSSLSLPTTQLGRSLFAGRFRAGNPRERRPSVRSGCRGNGACGLCLVQIEAGDVDRPDEE